MIPSVSKAVRSFFLNIENGFTSSWWCHGMYLRSTVYVVMERCQGFSKRHDIVQSVMTSSNIRVLTSFVNNYLTNKLRPCKSKTESLLKKENNLSPTQTSYATNHQSTLLNSLSCLNDRITIHPNCSSHISPWYISSDTNPTLTSSSKREK